MTTNVCYGESDYWGYHFFGLTITTYIKPGSLVRFIWLLAGNKMYVNRTMLRKAEES